MNHVFHVFYLTGDGIGYVMIVAKDINDAQRYLMRDQEMLTISPVVTERTR